MRRSSALVLLLLLAGCGGEPAPPTRPERQAAPAATPPRQLESVEIPKPGSRRALIYTWRDRFPLDLQGDEAWILNSTEYVKSQDLANTWKIVYSTKDGATFLQIAACEYVSAEAARQTYENVLAKVQEPTPLTVPECEKASAARLGDDAVAAVLSSRYLFIFDRPQSRQVGESVVKTVVKACFTEPSDVAPVTSPSLHGGG